MLHGAVCGLDQKLCRNYNKMRALISATDGAVRIFSVFAMLMKSFAMFLQCLLIDSGAYRDVGAMFIYKSYGFKAAFCNLSNGVINLSMANQDAYW